MKIFWLLKDSPPVAVKEGGEGSVERCEGVDQGGESEAGGEVLGGHLDHPGQVEGGPGEAEEQQGDGVHLGRESEALA